MNLPKRRKRSPMGLRESSVVRCQSHLSWTRGNECIVSGKGIHTCTGKNEAHHVKGFMDGGMGMKPGDDKVIPVCGGAHAEIHNSGAESFEKRYGVNLVSLAALNWKASPHRVKWERENG